ncbi:helix-turn-helix domain-containing protein [Streptacidiphilus sp. PAMC 29251]
MTAPTPGPTDWRAELHALASKLARPSASVRTPVRPYPSAQISGGAHATPALRTDGQTAHHAATLASAAPMVVLAVVGVGCACVLAKSPAARAAAAKGLRLGAARLRRTAGMLRLWAAFRFHPRYRLLAIRLESSRWDAMARNAALSKDATTRSDGGYLRRRQVRRVAGGARIALRVPAGSSPAAVRKQLPTIQAHLGQPTGTKIRLQPGGRDDRLYLHVRFNAVARMLPWTAPRGPVRLADPMRLSQTVYGDEITLDVRQRIGVFGTSGSGKSCVQRLIGAHVIAAVDADLDVWDLKQGLESQHYAGKAHRVTTVPDAVARVDWLLETEFPRRADRMRDQGTSTWRETAQDPALVLLVDEGNVLVRGFTAAQWDRFLTVAEQGRALGVYLVWSTQFPKASNLPTALRSQLNVRICLQLISSEEAAVVFKEDVGNGWAPHTLAGDGALLIKSARHTSPEESQAYWLPEDVFRTVVPGRSVAVPAAATVPLSKAADVPPMPTYAPAVPAPQTPVRRTLADRVLDALETFGTPLGVTELAHALDAPKSSTGQACKRLVADGLVLQEAGKYTALTSINATEEN